MRVLKLIKRCVAVSGDKEGVADSDCFRECQHNTTSRQLHRDEFFLSARFILRRIFHLLSSGSAKLASLPMGVCVRDYMYARAHVVE